MSDKITGAPNAFAQVKRGGVQPQPKNDGGKNDVPEEFKLAPDVNPKIGLQPNNQVDKNKEQSKSTLDVNPHVVHSAHLQEKQEPQHPWYVSCGVEVAKIGLLISASMVFGPIGGIIAGGAW